MSPSKNQSEYQNNPGQLDANNLRGKQMEQQVPDADEGNGQHQGEDEGPKRPNQNPKPPTQQQ